MLVHQTLEAKLADGVLGHADDHGHPHLVEPLGADRALEPGLLLHHHTFSGLTGNNIKFIKYKNK